MAEINSSTGPSGRTELSPTKMKWITKGMITLRLRAGINFFEPKMRAAIKRNRNVERIKPNHSMVSTQAPVVTSMAKGRQSALADPCRPVPSLGSSLSRRRTRTALGQIGQGKTQQHAVDQHGIDRGRALGHHLGGDQVEVIYKAKANEHAGDGHL